MRILHVINTLGASGGAEHGLVREITRFGSATEQMVVRLFGKDQLDAVLEGAGIEVISLGLTSEGAGKSWPVAAWRLRRILRSYRPDVVHTSLFMGNLVGQLAARGTSTPVLSTLTLSGNVQLLRSFQPGANSMRAELLRLLAASVARSSNVWFRAITEDAKTTNVEGMGLDPERVMVIPRGVDSGGSLSPPDRARFGLRDDVPLLVNVGRQSAQKGHIHLLGAFERIRQELPGAQLAIAGRTGDASEAISDAIRRRQLGDSVHLLGYRNDVDVLMASGDVFVFSSMMEGLGTAVLEAMQAKLPVVAFEIPPVREVTENGRLAHLVAVGDEARLASTVLTVLADPQRAEKAAVAAQAVANRFSIAGVASRLEELLRQIAAESVS